MLNNHPNFKAKMKPRHFTIPVFIPMEACPFQCIYCDQDKISGHTSIPSAEEITKTIQTHLSTMSDRAEIEVGFFGGTFTGLTIEKQKYFLETVQPFIARNEVNSIRLSTRPDFIDEKILELLKSYNVETIELGAQSMDDEVLQKSGRGHKAAAIEAASEMIKDFGFRLGLQMMIGLPGDSADKSLYTAQKFVELGAKDVRIYPTLVIKGTPLEKLFRAGKFIPLSLDEAVDRTAAIFPLFENAGVNIIRTGLHPSDGLLDKTDLIAGPFHVSFKELVLTKLWNDQLKTIENTNNFSEITISIPLGQLNAAVGYGAKNKKMLLQKFRKVKFAINPTLRTQEYHVDYR